MSVELAIRFLVYRNMPYQPGLDVHEYIDDAVIELARSEDFDKETEAGIFHRTFTILHRAMGPDAFKRWTGDRFSGMFLMSAYEVVAYGISQNIDQVEALPRTEQEQFIKNRIIEMWNDAMFQHNSGAGVRGTTRLRNLLPIADDYFRVA